jgi:hypothetical protein
MRPAIRQATVRNGPAQRRQKPAAKQGHFPNLARNCVRPGWKLESDGFDGGSDPEQIPPAGEAASDASQSLPCIRQRMHCKRLPLVNAHPGRHRKSH